MKEGKRGGETKGMLEIFEASPLKTLNEQHACITHTFTKEKKKEGRDEKKNK